MDTVAALISKAAEEFKANAEELLTRYSRLERDYAVNNPNSSLYILAFGNHLWLPLDTSGCQLQSRLRRDFENLVSILRVLLRGQPHAVTSDMEQKAKDVMATIDQQGHTWSKTIAEAVGNLANQVDGMVDLASRLYDSSENACIFVPDTNAVIYNPDLEAWAFDDSPRFTILFTPGVLSELDQLKVNHRNEAVRQKAEGLISRIKGYRTRGRLAEGVTLRRGRSTLRTLAVEPDIGQTLPWLKADNVDDRILATLVEVMRQHPRCSVVLVTRDVNLQNKAEFARLPFVEPPEPLKASES